jgi:SAM-dependent methyltransferase
LTADDPFWGDDPNSAINRLRRARDHLVPWVDATFPLAGATVLEYGCGHGAVSCAFATRAERVIGLDVEEEYIADGREFVAQQGASNVELHHHPASEILDAAAAHAGQIDVFLLYAVLEHLTLDERLDLLNVARNATSSDGVIVVCEAPNRLFPLDHHTTRLPFFTTLPDDLARLYWPRSERPDFRDAMDEAVREGREADALVRWGRGVSYHEFELVFDDVSRHVIASSYDPLLLGERPVRQDELALARVLERERPDLPPGFSRAWLDLIVTPRPTPAPTPQIRPWTMETTRSEGVGWTDYALVLPTPFSQLRVELPTHTSRLVLGVALAAAEGAVVVDPGPDAGGPLELDVAAEPGEVINHDVALAAPSGGIDVRLNPGGTVNFVGYEA